MQGNLIDQVLAEVLRSKQNTAAKTPPAAPVSTPSNQPSSDGPLARPNYQREKAQQRQAQLQGKIPPANPVGMSLAQRHQPAVKAAVNQDTEAILRKLILNDSLVSPKPVQPTVTTQKSVPKVNVSMDGAMRSFGQVKFIGKAAGNTLGYVIPNLDPNLRVSMGLGQGVRAVGVISSRSGAAAQILAVDEAVKKTSSKVLTLQLARDGEGGTGHGAYIVLGAEDVADVTKAVEIALSTVNDLAKNVIQTQLGNLEIHYTARSAEALEQAFGAPLNRAFGILIGAPAGVGLLMADTALKTAQVDVVKYWGPSMDSAFANEVWLMISGDPASVQNALEAAQNVGLAVLE